MRDLIGYFLVRWRLGLEEKGDLEGHLPLGSNSLRPCPPAFAQKLENSHMLLSYGWASQLPAKAEFPLGIPFASLGIITAGGASNALRLYPEKQFMPLAPLRGRNARSGSAHGCT
jgi:hypothetical protein